MSSRASSIKCVDKLRESVIAAAKVRKHGDANHFAFAAKSNTTALSATTTAPLLQTQNFVAKYSYAVCFLTE